MKNELRFLKQQECEIITKLRSERININDYMFLIKKNITNKCKQCNKKKKTKKGNENKDEQKDEQKNIQVESDDDNDDDENNDESNKKKVIENVNHY